MITNYQRSDVTSILRTIEKLYKNNVFRKYLNPSQLLLLKYLLELPNTIKLFIWESFLSGKLELLVELNAANNLEPSPQILTPSGQPSNNNDSNTNDSDDNDMIDLEQLKAQLDGLDFIGNLSLKVRYVVWENGLTLLDSEGNSDYLLYDFDDDKEKELNPPSEDVTIQKENAFDTIASKPQSDGDDNYDDDDDVEAEKLEETENQDVDKMLQSDFNGSTVEITPKFDKLDNGIVRLHIVITRYTLTELTSVNPYEIISNFHKIYHLFDNDKETLMRRLKLQQNDQMLENSRKRSHDEVDDDTENPSVAHKMLKNTESTSGAKAKSDIQMELGVANLSLRYLLKSVQQNKSKLDISDYELKHLIMDVRMNRSKWASDDKIGQEELYDACEKVVMELRNYTEHSTAFLNKVSKREAPNYYQIIKKPMDLNTVLKKLKTFQYNSKQEFVEDIMLIWRNCLTYNSDPKHFLRIHAIAMQKKSQQLLPLIPEITIRDRADVEKEIEELDPENSNKDEEEDVGSGRKGVQRRGVQKVIDDEEEEEEDDYDEKDETEMSKTSGKVEKPSKKKSSPEPEKSSVEVRNSPRSDNITQDASESSEETSSSIMKDTNEASTKEHTVLRNGEEKEEEQKEEKEDEEDNDEDEDEEEEEEEEEEDNTEIMLLERDDDKDDLELSTWKTLTAKARADICLRRSRLFNSYKLNVDSDAMLKNPSKLKQFDMFFEEFKKQKEAEFARQKMEQHSMMKNGFGAVIKHEEEITAAESDSQLKNQSADTNLNKESNEIDPEDSPLLTEYNISNNVPELAYTGIGKEYLDKMEENMVQKIMQEGIPMKSVLLNNIDRGLVPKMNHNIELIHEIRHICHKISLIRTLQNPNKPKVSNYAQKYTKFVIDDSIDLDPISQLDSHNYKKDERLINRVLYRNVSKIAMSNGFESTEPIALNMLSEITGDYLSNLIKTIKLHHETNSSNKRKPLNALNMTLLENGISKPDDLFSYMENEFGKKTRKLEDIKLKLSGFLKDLLRPTLQDISERNFEDESQSFLTGDFSSEVTGEDFFGFKELGLEKEFGELASNVPLQLLTFHFNGKDADVQVKTKVIQPEEFEDIIYKKVTKETVQYGKYCALAKPLLQKAVDRCSAYYSKLLRSKNADQVPKNYESPQLALLEDDEFPKVKGSTRSRLPPTGKISTNYKKKPASELFILPEEPVVKKTNSSLDDVKNAGDTSMDVDLFGSPINHLDNGFDVEEAPVSSFSLSLPQVTDN